MDRRELLCVLAGGIAGPWRALAPRDLLAIGQQTQASAAAGRDAPLRVLDDRLNRLVVAATERILPATDTPGAMAAGVNRFIDRLLADWYPAGDRGGFLAGLRELEQRSIERCGASFAECAESEQVALLTQCDEEVAALRQRVTGGRPVQRQPSSQDPDAHWFAMLKFMTVWGFCTSEIGIREVLRHDPTPGYFDGCAPLASAEQGGA